jgi:hypothetical protein
VANIVLVLVVLVAIGFVVTMVRRRRHGLVAERGTSIGADLGALSDQPRVRVRSVIQVAADRVRVVLTPDTGPDDRPDDRPGASEDLDFTVMLEDDDFGFEMLHKWKRSQDVLAVVLPPDTRIVRLRSVEDLQPLTLRRADDV